MSEDTDSSSNISEEKEIPSIEISHSQVSETRTDISLSVPENIADNDDNVIELTESGRSTTNPLGEGSSKRPDTLNLAVRKSEQKKQNLISPLKRKILDLNIETSPEYKRITFSTLGLPVSSPSEESSEILDLSTPPKSPKKKFRMQDSDYQECSATLNEVSEDSFPLSSPQQQHALTLGVGEAKRDEQKATLKSPIKRKISEMSLEFKPESKKLEISSIQSLSATSPSEESSESIRLKIPPESPTKEVRTLAKDSEKCSASSSEARGDSVFKVPEVPTKRYKSWSPNKSGSMIAEHRRSASRSPETSQNFKDKRSTKSLEILQYSKSNITCTELIQRLQSRTSIRPQHQSESSSPGMPQYPQQSSPETHQRSRPPSRSTVIVKHSRSTNTSPELLRCLQSTSGISARSQNPLQSTPPGTSQHLSQSTPPKTSQHLPQSTPPRTSQHLPQNTPPRTSQHLPQSTPPEVSQYSLPSKKISVPLSKSSKILKQQHSQSTNTCPELLGLLQATSFPPGPPEPTKQSGKGPAVVTAKSVLDYLIVKSAYDYDYAQRATATGRNVADNQSSSGSSEDSKPGIASLEQHSPLQSSGSSATGEKSGQKFSQEQASDVSSIAVAESEDPHEGTSDSETDEESQS